MQKTHTPADREGFERRRADQLRQDQLLRTLSFVRLHEDGQYDAWATDPSGDDDADFLRGGLYGVEFIEATVDGLAATFFGDLVEAAPPHLGPLEWGFLSTIRNAILLGSREWKGHPGLVVGLDYDSSTFDAEVLGSGQSAPLTRSVQNDRRTSQVVEGYPNDGVRSHSGSLNPDRSEHRIPSQTEARLSSTS
jgi:hypothetical protein